MNFAKYTSEVFDRKAARDFPVRDRQVVEIDADAHISDAFSVLLTHNLLCAPVWDREQSGYLGFFDVNDALSISYDIDLVRQSTGSSAEARQHMATSAVQVFEVFNKKNLIRNVDVPWTAVGPLAPMRDVVRVLATSKTRRVPVVDSATGRTIKVISQSDVCRQLHQISASTRESEWPDMFLQTPRGTGLGMHPVHTVRADEEAREAFRVMIDHDVTCVGVVDEANTLVGCIANRDIHIITKNQQQPKKPVPSFAAPTARSRKFSIAASMTGERDYFGMLAMVFVNHVQNSERRSQAQLVTASPDATFKHILDKLASTGQHRVFLVDELGAPQGVVSVSDICTLVWAEVAKDYAKPSAVPPPLPVKKTG